MRHHPIPSILRRIAPFGAAVFLAACSGAPESSGGNTPVPATPTIASNTRPDFQIIPPTACLVLDEAVIRTSTLQGDLLAWSPVAAELAYVASNERSDWNFGDLSIVSAEEHGAARKLAENAVGNLSWSPHGGYIVFAALRSGDGVYTLQGAAGDGSVIVDFFPGDSAKTDSWASPKIVREWLDDARFLAAVSCGPGCTRTAEIDIPENTQQLIGDPEKVITDFWKIHRRLPDPPPDKLENALDADWSPDGKSAAYFDTRGYAWVITPETKSQFLLPLGEWEDPLETKWSSDGEYLAVRAGFRLLLFRMNCGAS
jgi:dipeptidyl aminopeptidase/acylaminoacyl peptidase